MTFGVLPPVTWPSEMVTGWSIRVVDFRAKGRIPPGATHEIIQPTVCQTVKSRLPVSCVAPGVGDGYYSLQLPPDAVHLCAGYPPDFRPTLELFLIRLNIPGPLGQPMQTPTAAITPAEQIVVKKKPPYTFCQKPSLKRQVCPLSTGNVEVANREELKLNS
jgi:hypothetical protein